MWHSVKCLGIILTNPNFTHVEIKNKVSARNACNYTVQNLLFSCLLSRNKMIKIYKPIILFDVSFFISVKLGL